MGRADRARLSLRCTVVGQEAEVQVETNEILIRRKEKKITVRVVKHSKKMQREAAKPPSLETFKDHQNNVIFGPILSWDLD